MRTWRRCRRRSFGTTCSTPPTLRAVPKHGCSPRSWASPALIGTTCAASCSPESARHPRSCATTQWGALYDVAINVTGPAGRMHRVRTGWIIRAGEDQPQLLTAYVDLP